MKKRTTAIIVFALTGLFIALLTPKMTHVRDLKERSANLESELKKLRLENQALENELRLLRDDPVYIEKVARQKFNKAKEGEIVYKFVRQDDSSCSDDSKN